MSHDDGARSVVYVLNNDLGFDVHERAFHDAQQYALAAELPFAVVGVLIDDKKATQQEAQLIEAEAFLRDYDIPLMLLVGKRENALRGLSTHLSPLLVLPSGAHSRQKPVLHPHVWPGHVEPVASVMKMVRENPVICRF